MEIFGMNINIDYFLNECRELEQQRPEEFLNMLSTVQKTAPVALAVIGALGTLPFWMPVMNVAGMIFGSLTYVATLGAGVAISQKIFEICNYLNQERILEIVTTKIIKFMDSYPPSSPAGSQNASPINEMYHRADRNSLASFVTFR